MSKVIDSKTPEELKQIAIDIRAGRIFTDRHIQNLDDLSMVFMVFLFMKKEDIEDLRQSGVGLVYEYMEEANKHRSINGYPIFMSHKYLNIEDCKKLQEIVVKLAEAEKAVSIEPPDQRTEQEKKHNL